MAPGRKQPRSRAWSPSSSSRAWGTLRRRPTASRARRRARAAALVEAGDCGLPEAELLTLAEKLLEVDRGLLSEALALEINERAVLADSIDGQACVWLPHLRHAEDAIALAVRRLGIGEPPWPRIDADKAIDWVETRLGVTLAPGQRDAVAKALSAKILVVTGGPGVGKTTIIRAILTILRAKGATPQLAAATGRAR